MSIIPDQPDERLQREFPLFQQRDFEVLLNHAAWPIGIPLDLPEELWKRLCASSVSYQLGNQSVDYYKKHFLEQHCYVQGPHQRLDRHIQSTVLGAIEKRLDTIRAGVEARQQANEAGPLGEVIGDCTLARSHYSIQCAFSCANKGALYESLAIIRMILEQLAWVCAINEFEDSDSIIAQSATKSLGELKKYYATSGDFYGWLSSHAHWKYDAHIKSFDFSADVFKTILASGRFKTIAFAALTVFYDIFTTTLDAIRQHAFYADSSIMVNEIGGRPARKIMDAIREIAPDEEEISQLAKFLR
jgi:hypothetical protein